MLLGQGCGLIRAHWIFPVFDGAESGKCFCDPQPAPFQHYATLWLAQECVRFGRVKVGLVFGGRMGKRRKTEGCWDLMRCWNSGGDGFNYCWGLVRRGGGNGCVYVCACRGFAVCLRVGVHTLLQEHAEIHCLWCSLLCGLSSLSPTLFPLLPCPSYPVSLQLIVTAQNFGFDYEKRHKKA